MTVTAWIQIVALLIALPISVGAAIFTSEFAPQGIREVIKPAVELLAGIPSVVIGFFALMVLLVRACDHVIGPDPVDPGLDAGGVGAGIAEEVTA